jgi:hypothetical protein
MKTLLLATALTLGAAGTVLAAEFYVVQDAATKKCIIVDARPTTPSMVIVGDGRVFASRAEAESALSAIAICR